MKIFLTLFVLLFSSSMVAENLPTSIFGIELFKLNLFNDDQVKMTNENRIVSGKIYKSFYFLKDKVPKPNSNFDFYSFFTEKNDSIIHIIGSKDFKKPDYQSNMDEYECTLKKESLIQSLKLFYSIDKFNNVKFKSIKDKETSFYLIDRDYIKISNPGSTTYNRVLGVECLYDFEESEFRIRLDSREYYSNLIKGYEVVKFLDFDLLENDLSGL